jgi:protocatechuate 3,4-dioxygenase, beta subunit
MHPMGSTSRRNLVAAAGALLLTRPFRPTHAQTRLRATPSQTEGPYYPVAEPKDADHDLLRNGTLVYAKGQAAWVQGVVTDLDGKPLTGATVEIWQCDEAGHYDHPRDGSRNDPSFQGFGRVMLGAAGEFRFRTIKPVAYVGRTPHIHAKIKLGNRELLTTQLYVQGDAGNARDGIWSRLGSEDRALVTAPFVPATDGLQARYALAVGA